MPPEPPKYRPDIDGLRAIAVLAVIGFHTFPEVVPGGFVGVDVFFTLSGFLISTVIFAGVDSRAFSLAKFYSRRIARIFPALALVLIACFTFGCFALLPAELSQLSQHLMGGAGFLSNFLLWREAGYFDNLADTKPLLHLWSLGIEEQFYIIWPVVLAVSIRKRWSPLLVSVLLAAASFAFNIYLTKVNPVAAFYSPAPRLWEIVLGCIVAYLVRYPTIRSVALRSSVSRNAAAGAGMLLILFSITSVTKAMAFPGWWSLAPTVGSALMIAAGSDAWINKAILSNRALVWIGLISFPLYLWHWPLLAFARIMESARPTVETTGAAVLLAFVLAALTHVLLERRINIRSDSKIKSLVLCTLMLAIFFVGYRTYKGDGSAFGNLKFAARNAPYRWDPSHIEDKDCRSSYPWFTGTFCRKAKPSEPTILLTGDSHANSIFFGLSSALNASEENVLNLGLNGCPPLYGIKRGPGEGIDDWCQAGAQTQALLFGEKSATVNTIILAAAWLTPFSSMDISWDVEPDNLDAPDIFKKALRLSLARLTEAGKRVIFVLDTPELDFDAKSCVAQRPLLLTDHNIRKVCAVSRAEFDAARGPFREAMATIQGDYPKVEFFDAAADLCDDRYCWAMKADQLLYRDKDHLTEAGSKLVSARLAAMIKRL